MLRTVLYGFERLVKFRDVHAGQAARFGCAGRLAPTALRVRRREVIGGLQDGGEEERPSKDSRACPRQAIVDCA